MPSPIIKGLLGEGGMGTVYRATHIRLDKCVAVKVMASELTANAEALARFHREALVTGSLGHPHIVQVFDFSTTQAGEPFLVMEFLEGEDLDHRLNRVHRLPWAEIVSMVKQVGSALDATHAKGIVHRDLKPANIYLLKVVGETNFVKVLDFGISKMPAATRKLTRTSSVMGTPNYMSPEQALGKIDEIDERTDQWALACIVWECFSGERPFNGEEGTSILYQVVHEPPPPLLPKVPGLNPRVEAVLLQGMAKNKMDRFSSVNEFAMALESAVIGTAVPSVDIARTCELPVQPVASSQPATTLSRANGELGEVATVSRARSKKWSWAAAVGATAMVILAAILVLRPGRGGNHVVVPSPATPTRPVAVPAVSPVTPEVVPAVKAAPAKAETEPPREEAEVEPQSAPTAASPRPKAKRAKAPREPKFEGDPSLGHPSQPKKPVPGKKLDEEE